MLDRTGSQKRYQKEFLDWLIRHIPWVGERLGFEDWDELYGAASARLQKFPERLFWDRLAYGQKNHHLGAPAFKMIHSAFYQSPAAFFSMFPQINRTPIAALDRG